MTSIHPVAMSLALAVAMVSTATAKPPASFTCSKLEARMDEVDCTSLFGARDLRTLRAAAASGSELLVGRGNVHPGAGDEWVIVSTMYRVRIVVLDASLQRLLATFSDTAFDVEQGSDDAVKLVDVIPNGEGIDEIALDLTMGGDGGNKRYQSRDVVLGFDGERFGVLIDVRPIYGVLAGQASVEPGDGPGAVSVSWSDPFERSDRGMRLRWDPSGRRFRPIGVAGAQPSDADLAQACRLAGIEAEGALSAGHANVHAEAGDEWIVACLGTLAVLDAGRSRLLASFDLKGLAVADVTFGDAVPGDDGRAELGVVLGLGFLEGRPRSMRSLVLDVDESKKQLTTVFTSPGRGDTAAAALHFGKDELQVAFIQDAFKTPCEHWKWRGRGFKRVRVDDISSAP